jgi:hypothetical protein
VRVAPVPSTENPSPSEGFFMKKMDAVLAYAGRGSVSGQPRDSKATRRWWLSRGHARHNADPALVAQLAKGHDSDAHRADILSSADGFEALPGHALPPWGSGDECFLFCYGDSR